MSTSLQQTPERVLDEFETASEMLLEASKKTNFETNFKLELAGTDYIHDCSNLSLSFKYSEENPYACKMVFSWMNNSTQTTQFLHLRLPNNPRKSFGAHIDGISSTDRDTEGIENWNFDDIGERVFSIRMSVFYDRRQTHMDYGGKLVMDFSIGNVFDKNTILHRFVLQHYHYLCDFSASVVRIHNGTPDDYDWEYDRSTNRTPECKLYVL